MKTIENFVKVNAIDYNSLPYDGRSENEHNLTNKKLWGSRGVLAIKVLAILCGGVAINVSANKSGSIDRGYVSGFISSLDGTKTIYIQFADGMNDILYRTAKHPKDYTGGSNHNASISIEGFEFVKMFVNEYLKS